MNPKIFTIGEKQNYFYFQGDSGSPLVTTQGPLELVGIVSYGTAICAQGIPDVYTRVSSFLAFITETITNEIP